MRAFLRSCVCSCVHERASLRACVCKCVSVYLGSVPPVTGCSIRRVKFGPFFEIHHGSDVLLKVVSGEKRSSQNVSSIVKYTFNARMMDLLAYELKVII